MAVRMTSTIDHKLQSKWTKTPFAVSLCLFRRRRMSHVCECAQQRKLPDGFSFSLCYSFHVTQTYADSLQSVENASATEQNDEDEINAAVVSLALTLGTRAQQINILTSNQISMNCKNNEKIRIWKYLASAMTTAKQESVASCATNRETPLSIFSWHMPRMKSSVSTSTGNTLQPTNFTIWNFHAENIRFSIF